MTKLALIQANPRVIDGSRATSDIELSVDVCIIGSGAGGAVAAAVLAAAGRDVAIVEEGGYFTAKDFTMHEADTVPKLYQEAMQRATSDNAISILQGRAVGGTTVVNWTTSFRTPEDVVAHWADRHQVHGFKYEELVPHYEKIEDRLAIHKVEEAAMNPNNRKLFEGCKAMGWQVDTLRRNVHQCMQTGYCGQGCPVNAKRSMLVTLIPDAIDTGARLVYRCRIDRLEASGGEITMAHGTLLDADGVLPTGRTAKIRAKRFVLAGGAINSPAVLLRSGLNENGRVGLRTFLHPAAATLGIYEERIEAFYGAPQSAASHHFAHREGKVGMFLEAAPAYPGVAASATPGFGDAHRHAMETFDRTATHIAIAIDGFQDDVAGGTVKLRPSGAPLIEYPITPALWEAFRFAHARLAELQFASGAHQVWTLHDPPLVLTSPKDLDRLDAMPWEPGSVALWTAHQMGGCAMGDDATRAVVRSEDLRHHTLRNLYVMDGSIFPTSLGVNPQESIYGLTRLMATRLASLGA
jgi:choline dehydrogenase-like flavoprotein